MALNSFIYFFHLFVFLDFQKCINLLHCFPPPWDSDAPHLFKIFSVSWYYACLYVCVRVWNPLELELKQL